MKIAVIDRKMYPGDMGTFGPYVEYLGKTHDVTLVDEAIALSQARDIHRTHDLVWYEWANDFFREAMRHPKECKIVCRLHSYEFFTDWPANTYWPNVDRLVTVSGTMKGMLENVQYRFPLPPMDILPNGVDLTGFTIPENKDYSTKKIAYVGWLNHKKNPQMLLYIMETIKGKGYTLHIAGEWQDPRLKMYMLDMIEKMGLQECVTFYGRIPHDELSAWLADKAYIISTSLFESFGQALMEGIACGCLPLVHDWIGAGERFGPDAVFADLLGVKRMLFVDECLDKKSQAVGNLRTIAHHSLENQYPVLDSIIEKVGAA